MKLHTKYQSLGLLVSHKKIFIKFFPIQVYVKQVIPDAGHFLTQGYSFEQSW